MYENFTMFLLKRLTASSFIFRANIMIVLSADRRIPMFMIIGNRTYADSPQKQRISISGAGIAAKTVERPFPRAIRSLNAISTHLAARLNTSFKNLLILFLHPSLRIDMVFLQQRSCVTLRVLRRKAQRPSRP